ncbi:MAG: SDR family NAD(P)-dependent oxidoreductase [Gammaproteobacteria bacterium]|nr:SDR family NAD(P)-dependent oxidoreductase [Gammaproteobacteria bacterium]
MNTKSLFYHKNIWIIGASDGIGKAVAIALSNLGANLIISARSEEKLVEINHGFKNKAAVVAFDVSQREAFSVAAHSIFATQEINSILYFPGFYEPVALSHLNNQTIDNSIDINLRSVFTLLQCTLPYLKEHSTCQLAVAASVAGYQGLPNAQPYSATKAAVINLMESLKAEYPTYNIKLINPGFVKTRLTAKNNFDMPALISTERAAKYILAGLLKNNFEIHFPKKFTYILKMIRMIPYKYYFLLINKYFNPLKK